MEQVDAELLKAFAERMHEVCDDMGLPAERGRQSDLARHFGVTPKAARKWLNGDNYPELPLAIRIANWAQVNITWLLQGSGLKRGNRIDGKVAVLDEALHSLPPELGTDLVDNLRAKLVRAGKLQVQEPAGRYETMLRAYEKELGGKTH